MRSVRRGLFVRLAVLEQIMLRKGANTGASAKPKPLASCLLALTLLLYALPAFSQDIHLLSYAGPSWAWTDTDLSSLTGSAGAGFYSGMTGFITTPNDQFHVYYQDGSNNIRQLYFNGSQWSNENLTATAKGATAHLFGSGISGFSIGNLQYVYFVASNQHVHEYSYVNNWIDTDLTALTRGALAGSIYKMAAFATTPNNQRHVYFVATDSSIHQLYFNGSFWSDENLTSVTHGAKAGGAVWLGGCAVGNFQYVFFVSNTNHLHMYSYVNAWADTDWTALSGITGLSAVTGFATPGTTKLQMYFNDDSPDYDVYQLSYDAAHPGNWAITNLTADTGESGYAFQSVGFATTPNDQLHFYTIAGSSVVQYYFNGTFWSFGYLPGPTGDTSNGMTGFSVGNSQYVYYIYRPPAQ